MVICGLVILPALIASFTLWALSPNRRWLVATVQVGDPIVYRKQKASSHPGPRARAIRPAERGDFYYYLVNKFWTVENVLGDGRIVVRTRTNKKHYLRPNDPNLRKPKLIERLRYRDRFPQLTAQQS